MDVTRKQFVGGVLAVLASQLARPAALFGEWATTATSQSLGLATFQAQLNTFFQFRGADRRKKGDFLLMSITEKECSRGCEQFTLHFLAPTGVRLTPGTYSVQHTQLGYFKLYVLPAGSAIGGQNYYRADFNLLQGPAPK